MIEDKIPHAGLGGLQVCEKYRPMLLVNNDVEMTISLLKFRRTYPSPS